MQRLGASSKHAYPNPFAATRYKKVLELSTGGICGLLYCVLAALDMYMAASLCKLEGIYMNAMKELVKIDFAVVICA